MGKQNDAEANYFGFLRMAALAFIKGLSPMMAVELARRSIPTTVRPTFQEMEGGLPRRRQSGQSRRHSLWRKNRISATAFTEARPIIVIKKKKAGHGGHHGGAWKVAYADFVTAMMALFIVLWLMSADKEVQQAVSAYFNNPSGPGKLTGTAAAGLGQRHGLA